MDDASARDDREWRACLADLSSINRLLGGLSALRGELDRLPRAPRTILDAGTGAADMPAAVLDHLRKRGVRASCVAVDRSERVLVLAAERLRARHDIELRRADVLALPFADASFDLATFNLALHHFEPDDATRALRELARVAHTVIVNDLRRSRIAWLFAATILRAAVRSPLTKHDGPVSVLRAYTPGEARELAERAGWRRIAVRRHLGYRMTIVGGVA